MIIVQRPLTHIAALLAACLLISANLHTVHAGDGPLPGVVNINEANVEQLMLLPRIGQQKAERIVEYRQRTPFKTVLELGRVRGIGLKTLRLLKPYIRIDGPTTLAAAIRPDRASGAGSP